MTSSDLIKGKDSLNIVWLTFLLKRDSWTDERSQTADLLDPTTVEDFELS